MGVCSGSAGAACGVAAWHGTAFYGFSHALSVIVAVSDLGQDRIASAQRLAGSSRASPPLSVLSLGRLIRSSRSLRRVGGATA